LASCISRITHAISDAIRLRKRQKSGAGCDKRHDVDRDCDLSKIGVTVLRIQNETVREDPTAAADAILQKNQDPHPALRATLSRKRERALVDSEITRRV